MKMHAELRNLPRCAGLSRQVSGTETIMRYIASAALLAATLAASSAFAQAPQGDYRHHNFCLKTGSSTECAFDSMQQCLAAKHAEADTCEPNGPPISH
jgi:hypothetical protein